MFSCGRFDLVIGLSVSFQVYVLKRPHVDEFLQRMGELFECVLFTASLSKVLGTMFSSKSALPDVTFIVLSSSVTLESCAVSFIPHI